MLVIEPVIMAGLPITSGSPCSGTDRCEGPSRVHNSPGRAVGAGAWEWLSDMQTVHGSPWLVLWRKCLKTCRKHCDAHCLTGYDKVMRREVIEPDQWVVCITMSDAVGQAPLGGALILIHRL